MRYIKLFVFLFFGNFVQGQNLIKLSNSICDSISKNKEADSVLMTQASIYLAFLQNYFETDTSLYNRDKSEQAEFFNSINCLLTRQLNKTCSYFKIKESLILPYTSLVDMDFVFSPEQKKKIISLCTEIKKNNGVEILIFTIDDLFPFKNIEDFSIHKQQEWNNGKLFARGGLQITFDKRSKKARISTSHVSEMYFPEKVCQNIINNILLPEFKKEKYFEGIINALTEIEKVSN